MANNFFKHMMSQLIYFLIFFLVVLVVLSHFFSITGGWWQLAKEFITKNLARGADYTLQTGKVGWVDYRGCLSIALSDEGLHLSVFPLFRVAHPPLFIPWGEIHNAKVSGLLNQFVDFQVGSPCQCTIRLPKKIFDGRKVLIN